MTTPRSVERVMSLERDLLEDDLPSGNSPELQELMNELMGEAQDSSKSAANVPKNQYAPVKMTGVPLQQSYMSNVQRVNQPFASPNTNPNTNISTAPNMLATNPVRTGVIPPGRAGPVPARPLGPVPNNKPEMKSLIPADKQKEVYETINQYMNGALSYDKFGQTLLLLVGREAAVKIAESIKKEEMKTAPNPTAPGVIARPPGPPGQLGAPMMAQPGGLSATMTKKLTPGPTTTVGAPGVAMKGIPPGMPNSAVQNMTQAINNLGQPGNAAAMFNKIVATPMPVVGGAPVTANNAANLAKKPRPNPQPATGVVTIPGSVPTTIPPKSGVGAILPVGAVAQPGPAPVAQSGAAQKRDAKKEDGELEKIADPKAALKEGTDVTRMAGLDLKKELKMMTEDDSADDAMDKDNDSSFVNMTILKKRMSEIVQRRSLSVNEEALQYTSLALQEHLRNILEKLVKASQHRVEVQKDTFPVRVLSDPRKQLRVLEQKQREEEQRRRQTELEAAKSDDKNNASAAALQAIADKFKPKIPPGAPSPLPASGTTTQQPAPTPGTQPQVARSTVLGQPGQPTQPGQQPQAQATQGAQLGMAALQSGPPNFTHQHLHQLQQLQSLQQQGKLLQPNQQKLLAYLRTQLHRLHEYQKLQGAFKKQDPTPPDPKKITLKDAMFLESVIPPSLFQKFEVHQKRKRKFQTISLTKT